jgi:uncharacterized membrane protein
VLLPIAAVVSIALPHLLPQLDGASGLSLYVFLLLAVTVTAANSPADDPRQRFAAVLMVAGWGLAAVSELVVVTDRMNTVFKLYHPAWMLLALGLAGALGLALERRRELAARARESGAGSGPRLVPRTVSVILLAAAAITAICTLRAVTAVVTLDRRVSDRPTLDGLDFLRHGGSDDAELLESVSWLDATVRGPQVTAEAFTNAGYDESARVAKYTGLPILLGWPHHIKQRGRTEQQLASRSADLMQLYSSDDPAAVAEVCRRYGIRYVFVGDLERKRYRDPEERFARMPFLHQAFRSSGGQYAVYEVASAVATGQNTKSVAAERPRSGASES